MTTTATTLRAHDKVRLTRPDNLDASPLGWHPTLDRYVGRTLTVRLVADAGDFAVVLVHEHPYPIRDDWLAPAGAALALTE